MQRLEAERAWVEQGAALVRWLLFHTPSCLHASSPPPVHPCSCHVSPLIKLVSFAPPQDGSTADFCCGTSAAFRAQLDEEYFSAFTRTCDNSPEPTDFAVPR
eukprot:4435416-Pleurochrysis_carterae.AAC.1